ncbi:tRNA-splicing endonuclease subunit Sen54 isoform X4 [Corvus moneduloides]|uniref:tRNA-splicing endonuclease subunit Sen54 isoform X4 n=1 Tax=Corvus moneduloides TaxID=1196302 RepID=UPI0013627191|nr:tRNA-splicing endonuclease subunit Sen54 isoform X4 [Corvus moneduloides]
MGDRGGTGGNRGTGEKEAPRGTSDEGAGEIPGRPAVRGEAPVRGSGVATGVREDRALQSGVPRLCPRPGAPVLGLSAALPSLSAPLSPRSTAEQPEGRQAPRRPRGQKDFVPDGSARQAERLRRCCEEQWRLLSEERPERPGNLVKAEWKPEQGIVELKSPAGKFWHTMGFSERGKQCLLPEEALYLLECGSVQLFYRDLPLSVQEAYETLLCQEAMSLSHYQVFSHLKQLGYIVLRFNPSTVLSAYERQLNLESHCKSSGKHHCKRRRSSSPQLHEKKCKVSEDLPEAEGTSSKDGDDCGDSIPMDEKALSVQPKESDAGSAEGESMPVPLDTGQKHSLSFSSRQVGDHKESSTGTHAPRWDFNTITFPNVAPDQPCTHLPSPDNRLLPENVPGREVDAASWCTRINQKQEKLSRKERKQWERESRYKSSVNADQEVRRCSNWQEYKALLEQRRQQRVWKRPSHLWDQAVTPLLRPEEVTSPAALLQQISVLQPSHILDGASRFDEQIPSLRALKQVTYLSGDVPLVFALVDHGEITFYSLKEFKLPIDVNH